MKIFLLGAIITILISGCATKNAFSKLDMKVEQTKAVENTRSGKMVHQELVGGIFSAIYLNNVYQDIDKGTQQFYISIFMKENLDKLHVTFNGEKPLESKKLPSSNEYSHLLPMKNEWSSNYLVTFKKTQKSSVTLVIDNGPFSSDLLSYPVN